MGKRKRGNGEGTIWVRNVNGKKVWVAEYTIGFDDQR